MITALVLAVLSAEPPARMHGQQHMDPPKDEHSLKAEIANTTASTTLPDWKGYNFSPKNLIDGDQTTSWQPKTSKKGGADEWVQIELKRDCVLDRIEIANGLQMEDKLGNLFHKNNRVNAARLVFSDASELLIELDANEFGYVRFEVPKRKATRSLKLEVQSVHKGTKWNDLAISELNVYGTCAP